MKSIESNFKIYIPVDESKEPKDLTVDDGASIQVRVLHNDKIYLRKTESLHGFHFAHQVKLKSTRIYRLLYYTCMVAVLLPFLVDLCKFIPEDGLGI